MSELSFQVRRISTGSTVGVFSPSEPLTPERVSKVEQGIQALQSAGFRVKIAPHWRDVSEFTAGTIRDRVADMHALVADDSVHILMSSWGGKSAAQLLPFLEYELFRTARKPICAFSDGCIILNAVTAMTGLATFYGPNVVGKLNESNYGDLSQFTQDGFNAGSTISLKSKDTSTLRAGTAEGILVGGNLSSYVISVIGSRFAPAFSDCILFWESGPKSAQELDMLLTAVRNSAQYSTIRAMLIGDVLLTDDSKWGNRTLSEIVADIFNDASFPILHAPIFGHEPLPNPAIPIGCPARLDTERAELTLTQTPLMD